MEYTGVYWRYGGAQKYTGGTPEYTEVYWGIQKLTFSTMNVVMPCSFAAMSVLA